MNASTRTSGAETFAALRRFARSRSAVERCELCGLELAREHRHLLEVATRKIACACDPCALRFSDVVGGKFKLIPRDARVLADFRIEDAQWDDLALPINLVFLFHDSVVGKLTALYPGPAGVTESLLRLEAWEALVAQNPALARMEPDVEALLVNRVGEAREYFIAPMDVCFELVGLIRLHWHGLSGGNEVWHEIGGFFERLRARNRRRWRVPELDYRVTGVEAAMHELVPLLHFKLAVTNSPATRQIHSAMLQAQVQIEATHRSYNAAKKEKLTELFGTPERWGQTLRTQLWAHASTTLRAFTGSTSSAASPSRSKPDGMNGRALVTHLPRVVAPLIGRKARGAVCPV